MLAMEDVLLFEIIPPNSIVWYEWVMEHYLN